MELPDYFHFAAETFRLQLEGMGSERAPAPPAMRGSPRPANDALPHDARELDRFIRSLSDDELAIWAFNHEQEHTL